MSRTETPARPLLAREGKPRAGYSDRKWTTFAGISLIGLVALAYANSLHGPFVYDDKSSILYNGTIRHLADLRQVFTPPIVGATVGGRPILNLSFAINYAVGGLDVRGYHVANALIHLLSALTLFGLVRRTLRLPSLEQKFGSASVPFAFVVAGLWAAHPLDTEAITYVVQRAESLMSLFFLLTLYCFVRSLAGPRPLRWQMAAWLACLLGMATKENMAAAPIAALLFDRAFVSGSLRDAWRARRKFYLALASTWLVVALLILRSGGDRGGSMGFDVGVSPFQYLLTQIPAFVRYASLSLWPGQQVFDYGVFYVTDYAALAWQSMIAGALVGFGLFVLWRHPKLGFLSGTALAILAPTSLMPGTTQMIVEHRMYLPLAATLGLLVPFAETMGRRNLMLPAVLAILALVVSTAARNRVYRDELLLWADAVAKRPESLVAHSSLGAALANAHRRGEAIKEDRWVLSVNPNYAPSLANLGIALTEAGEPKDALPYLVRALGLDPTNAQAHLNLGVTLDMLNRPVEALPQYAAAVRINPLLPDAQNDYGDSLCRAGRVDEGISHLNEAIRLSPEYRDAYLNLASALVRRGQMSEARVQFAKGVSLRPSDATPYLNWANFLLRQGHRAEAMAEYETALRLRSDDADVHYSYATALASGDRLNEAVPEFEAALRLRPAYAEAHNNLGNTLLALDRVSEAIPHYEEALRYRPEDAATHNNLGLAYARTGKIREATREFEAAVKLAPDFANARENLSHAREQMEAEGAR